MSRGIRWTVGGFEFGRSLFLLIVRLEGSGHSQLKMA